MDEIHRRDWLIIYSPGGSIIFMAVFSSLPSLHLQCSGPLKCFFSDSLENPIGSSAPVLQQGSKNYKEGISCRKPGGSGLPFYLTFVLAAGGRKQTVVDQFVWWW